MNKKVLKNENEKIFDIFIKEIQKVHQLIHEKYIYSYLCNFYENSKDKKYWIIQTLNEILKEIRYIGKSDNFKFSDKATKSFFISSYLYYLDQTFQTLISILNKSKIISDLLKEKYDNSECINLMMIIRKTLHHPFDIWISIKELIMIYNSKNLTFQRDDKELIKKIIDINKTNGRSKFSLSYYSPYIPSSLGSFLKTSPDAIWLFSFDRLKNDFENNISIGFDFSLLLNKNFVFLVDLLKDITKEIKSSSKELGKDFNFKLKQISKLKDRKQIINNLEIFLFDDKLNMFKDNSDLSVENTFIAKYKILIDFLETNLKSNSIILKLFNKYLKNKIRNELILEEFETKSEINRISNNLYGGKFYDKFSNLWPGIPPISLDYAREKIGCSKIVILDRKNHGKTLPVYSSFIKEYENVRASVDSSFYKEDDPAYRQIYNNYFYYIKLIIINCLNNEQIKKELLILFKDDVLSNFTTEINWKLINSENVINNILLSDFLEYVCSKYNKDEIFLKNFTNYFVITYLENVR